MLFISQQASPGSFTWSSLASQELHDTFIPKLEHLSEASFRSRVPLAKAGQRAKTIKGGKLTLPLDGKSFRLTLQRGRNTGKEKLQGHLQPVTMKKAAISFIRAGGGGHSEKVSQTWGHWSRGGPTGSNISIHWHSWEEQEPGASPQFQTSHKIKSQGPGLTIHIKTVRSRGT